MAGLFPAFLHGMDERPLHSVTAEELLELNCNKSSFVLLALSYLNDRELAEDIYQESLLYVLENRDTLMVGNMKWYFSRILLNKCLYHLRQSKNRARIRDDIRTDAIMAENISILSDRESELTAFNADFAGCLEECRKSLPESTYRIFLDAKIKGMSYKDISELYGISVRKVTSEMQKALAVFRRAFRDYWFLLLILLHRF